MKKREKNSLEKRMFKKTIDGMISICLRMFYAQEEEKDFAKFCNTLINDTPAEFYARPIIKKGEENAYVHD